LLLRKTTAVVAAGLTCLAGLPAATTPPKKPVPPQTAAHKPAPHKTAPTGSHKTAPTGSARRTSHKPASRATQKASAHGAQKASARAAQKVPARSAWHPGQTAPTPDRYKEIQEALAKKGYLHGEADGVWNQDSADALRRFQQDQNLQASGKLDSLSIIALGLGPKH
jgi:hypothetical protein